MLHCVAKVQPPKAQSQLPTAFHTKCGTLRAQHTSCVWDGVHHEGSILRTHGFEVRNDQVLLIMDPLYIPI